MGRLLRRWLAVSLLVGAGIGIGAYGERKGWGGLRPGAALKEAAEKLRDAPKAVDRAVRHYWHDDAHYWAHGHAWPYYYPSGWWVVERREAAPAQPSGGTMTVAPAANVELRAAPAAPPRVRIQGPAPALPAGARRKPLTGGLLER